MRTFIGAICASLILFIAQPAEAIHISWKAHKKVESLTQDIGHYVMVHFWASWCQPCRDEMPELAAWAKAHPNIIFVPISLDDTEHDAKHFLQTDNLTGVPLLMGTIHDASRIGIRAIPTTLIIDPKGHVIKTIHGARPWGADTFSQSVLETMGRHSEEVKD